MKKVHLLITSLILSSAVTSAATSEESGNRAINFLQDKWQAHPSQARAAHPVSTPRVNIATFNGAVAVNVCNGSNMGFVLYANDADDAPLIGYGLSDTLNVASMPPAAAEFIAEYQKAISTQSISASNSPSKAALYPIDQDSPTYPYPTIDPVEPLITTKWGQDEPFNAQCPLYKGKRSVAGCTAVALAQMLNFFKPNKFNNYILEYTDSNKSMEEVSLDFSSIKFDYNNMLDEYIDGQYTDEQAAAVARLMYVCAGACKSEWTSSETSGNWPLVALDKYLNYNATYLYREELPTDYWMTKIQENLAAHKPMLYGGSSYTSSHIFILDGIDAENYIHINWGWGGLADGYYDITLCHPTSFSKNDEGYFQNQSMICDIEPRSEEEHYQEQVRVVSRTTLDGAYQLYVKCYDYITNSYDAFSNYRMRILAQDLSDNSKLYQIGDDSRIYYSFPSSGNFSNKEVVNRIWTEKETGEYEIILETFNNETGEHVSYTTLPLRPYVKVSEGSIVETGYIDYPEGNTWGDFGDDPRVIIDSLTPMTDVIAKAPFYAKIKTHSVDDGGSNYLFLRFTNTETGKVYKYDLQDQYHLHYTGLYYESIIYIAPPKNPDNGFSMPAGRYLVDTDLDNGNNKGYFAEPCYLDVAPEVDYPILAYIFDGTLMPSASNDGLHYSKTWSDKAEFRFSTYYDFIAQTVNNNYNPVKLLIYARRVGESQDKEILFTDYDFDPAIKYSSGDIPGYLYPFEGKYIFYMRYMTPDGERDFLPASWSNIDEETGLPATPTTFSISSSTNTTIPKIEVGETAFNGTSLSLKAKNIGNNFSGYLRVTFYDTEHNRILEYSSERITIDAQEEVTVNIPTEIDINSEYRMTIKAMVYYEPQSGVSEPQQAFTTKSNGEVAQFSIEQSQVGFSDIAINRIKLVTEGGTIKALNAPDNCMMRVYSIDGKLIKTGYGYVRGLSTGIYIVQIDNQIFKVGLK